jgi:hypothetical protein
MLYTYVQYLIVGLIVLGAFLYAASNFRRKARAFSKRSGCSTNCGCSDGNSDE